MSRHIPNAAFDAYFAYFQNAVEQHVTSDESTPTDLTNSLAVATIDSGADISIGAGSPDGRRMTVAEKLDVAVDADGTTNHAALVDGSSNILIVTTTNQRTVSAADGDRINMSSWYLNVSAPAAP